MANTTYYLSNIEKGDIMAWSVYSQTGSAGTITLKDDEKIYFQASKSNTESDDYMFQVLKPIENSNEVTYDTYTGGNNLRIEISLNETDIKQAINAYNVMGSMKDDQTKSEVKGHGYNIFIEDSTDNDFNDYYINIVAWKYKN